LFNAFPLVLESPVHSWATGLNSPTEVKAMSTVSRGLEDVFIKQTSLTFINGEAGILRYRGYDIKDLALNAQYEEVAYLMFYGDLPNVEELRRFKEKIERGYDLPEYVIKEIKEMPKESDALSLMEIAYAAMSAAESKYTWSKEADREKGAEIIGRSLSVVANIYRHKEGLAPVMPKPNGNYAYTFLRACFDREPSKELSEAMNSALILYVDHEVPASTTAALVAASTLSDMYSTITAALAALKGPLHGGAAESAYEQFLEIGDPSNVENWFQSKIVKEKRRLMGFGHRVYRTFDPRMFIFKEMAERITKDQRGLEILKIAERLEKVGLEHFASRKIFPNTDYYSGLVFSAIGFPVYMFTPLFALSRMTGWLAHVMEYVEEQHRLIRPRALYVGPGERQFKRIEERG
jgi:citrate synthase